MKTKKGGIIGVFDSGFGGLSFMKELVKELPHYNYIYLGDTARVPYGNKPKKIVYKFTKQAVDFLFKNGCEIVIFACNTVSSDALRKIQQKYLPKYYPTKKVLGVIIPSVEHAATKSKNKKIGVMATQGTVKSGAFKREFLKINPKIKIFSKACPLLVPLIETGKNNLETSQIILQKYLQPLLIEEIDTLVLGCTHYSFLEDRIKKIVGQKVRVISGAKIISRKFKKYLQKHPEIDKKLIKKSQYTFYSTGLPDKFEKMGSQFLGKKIKAKNAEIDL